MTRQHRRSNDALADDDDGGDGVSRMSMMIPMQLFDVSWLWE